MLSFYKGKRVLITGHTGFKGSWICQTLLEAGAELTGYALQPPTVPALFDLTGLADNMQSVVGDVRDLEKLEQVFAKVKPEIVIHMAAQPLVRESYENPVYTYDVNVMGTVNVLESVRKTDSVRSVINVTTDKVYRNREWVWGYREDEELNGFDPYSNSKSCSELVTSSYKNSFFEKRDIAVTTLRAGNVIGGGDFARDRIVPDCIRAAERREDIIIRNPYSVRPYQHVLEPVMAYLMVAAKQFENKNFAGCYNIGPEEADCQTTGNLADIFCRKWKEKTGQEIAWINQHDGGPHEASLLKLDCAKLKQTFGWHPVWNLEQAIDKTVEWQKAFMDGKTASECMKKQIWEYTQYLTDQKEGKNV